MTEEPCVGRRVLGVGLAVSLGSLLVPCVLFAAAGCKRNSSRPEVVVYTSVDQVYAEEALRKFERETGIVVKPVFDTEAAKTTGLFMRLRAEKDRPRADVFWNNELTRTLLLAQEGIADDLSGVIPKDLPRQWVDPEGKWAAFSLRARVIVYNTNLVKPEDAPRSLQDLVLPKWRGKVAIANPLFGTTAAHVSALFIAMGDDAAKAWLQALRANEARMVEGNSTVRDLVARGEALVGLTDTDDVFSGIADGKPIDLVLPDQDGLGTLAIPNSVVIVKGGPHPEPARRLAAWLMGPALEEFFAANSARQIPVRDNVPRPKDLQRLAGLKAMDVDYALVAERMPGVAQMARDILGR